MVNKIIALLTLILLSPILGAIALLVGKPYWYNPRMIGEKGKPFKMYKFRSMAYDCDTSVHKKHLADIILHSKPNKKLVSDPRITPIGRILRKHSLDELPQLINVLRGEMNIIGPRPSTEYEWAMYPDWARGRTDIKPGLTGLWQISKRDSGTFEEMIKLDLWYIENRNMAVDLYILIMTVVVVLAGIGGR